MERLKNKNSESDEDLGLDSRQLLGGHNNQLIVNVRGRGNIEEKMRPGRNVWGGAALRIDKIDE
jgi:hypothetical protein